MPRRTIMGDNSPFSKRYYLEQFDPNEVKAVFKDQPLRVWVVRAHDEVMPWTLEHVFPQIPTNYKPVIFKLYPSTEQGEIALILYVREDIMQKEWEFEQSKSSADK
ncbi:MAG TPA: hypothetical protein VH186_20905 [Chloroflexia bacterium]|nr:hypothetical protein [Chloroflexia bacterium]